MTTPIHDERAERALVGAALHDQGFVDRAAEIVGIGDFYDEVHRTVWAAIVAIHRDGADVDCVTVAAELDRVGRMHVVGSYAAIDAYIDSVPVTAHPLSYAQTIASLARRRDVADRCRRLHARANDPAVAIEDVQAEADGLRQAAEWSSDELPLETNRELMSASFEERQEWLVEGWWAAEGCGFLGGYEKSSKSLLALSLAISVASGHPWLGRWPVRLSGPVICAWEEDHRRTVHDRVRKVCSAYGIDPDPLPLHHGCQRGLHLTTPKGRGRLAQAARRIKPVLIVLDPWRRIAPGVNENDSGEVSEVLGWLRWLQVETGSAVMVLHHLRKAGQGADKIRIAHRLRGSGDFAAWYDSLIGVEKKDREEHRIVALHRAAAGSEEYAVGVRWDDHGHGLGLWTSGEPVAQTSVAAF